MLSCYPRPVFNTPVEPCQSLKGFDRAAEMAWFDPRGGDRAGGGDTHPRVVFDRGVSALVRTTRFASRLPLW